MSAPQRLQIRVSGRVQAVGYRYAIRQAAEHLAVAGWVKNLEDGDVLIEAQGEPAQLAAFLQAVRKGSRYSQVLQVQIHPVGLREESAFYIAG